MSRCRVVCDRWLPGLVLLTLVKTCEASTSEQVVIPGGAPRADFNTVQPHTPLAMPAPSMSTFSLPSSYESIELPQTRAFSSQDFRPRGRSALEKEPPNSTFEDAPMIRGTTVWQRMADYRSHDRVRLLTLWETGGSTISLLAGKKGEPSLQWTSRLMNRGGATRGLLDQFFSASLAGAARGLHFSPRAAGADSSSKPAKLAPAAAGSNK